MPTLDKKLYQLIISRLDGDKLSSEAYEEQTFKLVQKGIGGFILFGGKKEEVRGFTDMLQSVSTIPLFIASDIERGVGQQIEGASPFPCQMAIAAAINKKRPEEVDVLQDIINAISNESIDIGINMPLIPVLDVNTNPDNPIICTRAFSDNPEDVAWYGSFYIRMLERAGLVSCAKHFPGHGDTSIDSHISLPVINKPLSEFHDTDIYPFKRAIEAGVSSIMTGHISIPEIDELPASLSKKVITGLLRDELGFDGLIITDALNMHALNEINGVPGSCLNAGVDILLHPADADRTVDELRRDVAEGKLNEETIDRAVERIMRYKKQLKGIRREIFNCKKCTELSEIVYEDSITLVKDSSVLLPLGPTGNVSLVHTDDDGDYDLSPIKAMIAEDSDIFNINTMNIENIISARALNDIVIFALFTNVAAWRGSSGIGDKDRQRIKELIRQSGKSIVISFGSPYVLRHFDEADILIAAYDSTIHAQSALVRCLTSERNFHGSLPVKMFSD